MLNVDLIVLSPCITLFESRSLVTSRSFLCSFLISLACSACSPLTLKWFNLTSPCNGYNIGSRLAPFKCYRLAPFIFSYRQSGLYFRLGRYRLFYIRIANMPRFQENGLIFQPTAIRTSIQAGSKPLLKHIYANFEHLCLLLKSTREN